MIIRERTRQDDGWVGKLLLKRWGGTTVIAHGEAFDLMELPALVADPDQGLATFRLLGDEAELMSLDALCPGHGVGTFIVSALRDNLRKRGIVSLWVMTTNDNLTALRFYQRRGFELQRLRPGVVAQARLLKPEIPEIGDYGIPIRDELDLCLRLR